MTAGVMSRLPTSFPHTIKEGSVSIKIYRIRSRGYDLFQVADYSTGRRKLQGFGSFADAKRKAKEDLGSKKLA